jgi:hypothetical protein
MGERTTKKSIIEEGKRGAFTLALFKERRRKVNTYGTVVKA